MNWESSMLGLALSGSPPVALQTLKNDHSFQDSDVTFI